MCKVLDVSRSSYYGWLSAGISNYKLENIRLGSLIKDIFYKSYCNYGARRIRKELMKKGEVISRRRVRKLMKENELNCKTKRKFKVTTDSNHNLPIAPNILQRDFTASTINQKYVGDITYIWTNEGWLYLAVVIDLFSRKVVGWSIKKNMAVSLVNDALMMALLHRKPDAGLIWHTDRGSQYASINHRELLNNHGIIQSMSRKGNCWDNAVAESFFHTLKTELTYHFDYETRDEAKQSIFEFIEIFYNQKRSHSSNNYYSPAEFEMNHNLH